MRERRKEPREGSEIDPETACIQTVGAPALIAFGLTQFKVERGRLELGSRRTFCIMGQRLTFCGELNRVG